MKKFALKSAVLAISALAAASAFAAKSLDAAVTANKYASELAIDATTGLALLDGAITDLNLTAAHGVAPGVNVTTYVRVDLGNGAKFVANPTSLVVAAGASTTGAGTGTLSSGGIGASYVIYALSPTTNTEGIQADGVMTLTNAAGGIKVFNTNSVSARIRVFETLTAAANPDSSLALKDSTARNIITFTPALTATITQGSLVADVNPASGAAYTKFTPVVAAGSSIGQVDFAAASGVAIAAGTQATLDNLLTDTSDVTFAGDFTFAKAASEAYTDGAVLARVFLGANADCTTGTEINATAVTASSASFNNLVASALDTAGSKFLCVNPVGTVAIPAGNYTMAVDYDAETGYTVADLASTAFGAITRNGTTLIAPLTNQPTGWFSRLVLTNSGSSARTYAVTAIAEDGTTVSLTGDAAGGTVAANQTKVVNLQLLSSTVGLARYGLQVVVNGPASQVSGAYQLVNSTTGSISNTNLIQK